MLIAIIWFHSYECWPISSWIPIGTVRMSSVRVSVSANRYSFHGDHERVDPDRDEPGHRDRHEDPPQRGPAAAPSTLTDSSSSRGSVFRYAVIMMIAYGRVNTMCVRIRPDRCCRGRGDDEPEVRNDERDRRHRLHADDHGVDGRWNGNVKRLNAYPASMATSSVRTVTARRRCSC